MAKSDDKTKKNEIGSSEPPWAKKAKEAEAAREEEEDEEEEDEEERTRDRCLLSASMWPSRCCPHVSSIRYITD